MSGLGAVDRCKITEEGTDVSKVENCRGRGALTLKNIFRETRGRFGGRINDIELNIDNHPLREQVCYCLENNTSVSKENWHGGLVGSRLLNPIDEAA